MPKTQISQPEFPDFYLPFGGKLDSKNRWVRLAQLVPWDVVESCYQIADKAPNADGMGQPALAARIAFGSLIIKAVSYTHLTLPTIYSV